MSYLKERVAYLKGLADGMNLDVSTNEGKLLKAMLEVMDDVALSVDDLEEVQEQLSEQVDEIDEDLADIEKIIFNEEDDDEDAVMVSEVECPYCHKVIEVDEDMFDEDGETLECPHCHEKIEIDWDCDCGCDDRDECCGHDHEEKNTK